MFDTINERVAHYRKLANLNQAEAAERMGMKLSTYSQMERKGNISAERIKKLAQIFGVEPMILLFGEPEKTPVKPNTPDETVVTLEQPKPVLPPVPQPFILSNKEKSIITILRNLSKKEQDEVVAFIESKRKKRKK